MANTRRTSDPALKDGTGEEDEMPNPGQQEVQAAFDRHQAQGFRGAEVDPTPNEHYSVAGVTAGKPTPETTKAGA